MKILRCTFSGVVLLASGIFGIGAQVAPTYKEGFLQFAGIPAVTGREAQFVAFLRSRLPAGTKSEIDNMGNLTVQIGDTNPQLLVVTSVDEPGFVVTEITEDGYLRVASPGGRAPSTLFAQFHEGHYVDIAGRGGSIRGVVALPSSHLVRGRRENLTAEKMLIDIGARSRPEAASRGIELLEPVTAVKDIAVLAERRIAGPMLSRKLGAFALVEVLKASEGKAGKNVVFAWATQGAMSNSGVARLARRFSPKQVLLVGAFQRGTGPTAQDPVDVLDSGVLIPDSGSPGTASPLLRGAVDATAGKVKVTPSPVGALQELRAFSTNSDLCPVAIPVAYPGSLVETIDLDDLQQLIEFIKAVVSL
jgi:putative aminopeptidase FrvX